MFLFGVLEERAYSSILETLPLTDARFASSPDGLSDGLSVGLSGLLGSVGVVGVEPLPELALPSSTDTLICVLPGSAFGSIALKSTAPFISKF